MGAAARAGDATGGARLRQTHRVVVEVGGADAIESLHRSVSLDVRDTCAEYLNARRSESARRRAGGGGSTMAPQPADRRLPPGCGEVSDPSPAQPVRHCHCHRRCVCPPSQRTHTHDPTCIDSSVEHCAARRCMQRRRDWSWDNGRRKADTGSWETREATQKFRVAALLHGHDQGSRE